MIQSTIYQYVRTMFDESRDGQLLAGDADNQFDYSVEWNEEIAETLAQRCSILIGHLAELSRQFDMLRSQSRHLSQEQLEVWNTYLRPFPKHNLDMETLQEIWEKFAIGESVTEEEQTLANQYVHWFEENAKSRLPVKRCDPVQVLNRARRYSKLIRLDAPVLVQEAEAKRFAEEFVLYHCLKQ